ncbi:vomeronasal type-2 receptor 116-like [Pseudophryne corroboree]|uniref:vomeronasal type-2 receptor 116-like n=1 Tax=Pseudophryne corroboree TaxID=495146 RepID=UPI0030813820
MSEVTGSPDSAHDARGMVVVKVRIADAIEFKEVWAKNSNFQVSSSRFTQSKEKINYGATDPVLNDRLLYPTFSRIVPDDQDRYAAIVKCLLHFGWNWVGVITPSDGSGDMELLEMSKLMSQQGICIEFITKLSFDLDVNRKKLQEMKQFTARILQHSMRNLHYTDPTGEEMTFNERGDLPSKWLMENWVIYKTNTSYEFVIKPVTIFDESQDDQFYNIKAGEITWKNGMIPTSRCNDRCPPGYRKAFNGGFHVCCYDCVPCSEGEISNTTDSEICHRCPDEEWPDERRVRCVPKIYDFLSYEKDIVVQISAVTASSFSAITLFILGNFIYYWNTPIVKANNRAVSFILLISMLLSFLSVFLFLGQPVDITCRLRQTSFGIFFSTAVSSVLAKTVTVFIAFKATKPGSSWRKWVTLKVSKHVVIVFSSLQVLICGIWLTVSSPYQEYDHHSYKGMIIIQCNEGSVLGLYSMLGYIGILASVNFALAFMVRTLPDSFNEAKYITFSMLVFCSVWIAMIPAYLSTKGKYMVAVEIFAILTSCAGVLGCIFFPKLYILLRKPAFNSRKTILGKNTI